MLQGTSYFQQGISDEIPEFYNEIPIREDGSFVCGGYNWPSLDESGQIYWPKSVVKHVGLENLPSDNFEISIGPFGEKRIVSQQEMEKQHKFAVEKEWLKSPNPKLTAQKSESLIFTNSNEYLKVRPCANHIKNDEKTSSILHILGESCQENRIYLSQKVPFPTHSTTATTVVSSFPVNTVKLCDRPFERSEKPKEYLISPLEQGPTFGLDTIYGDIENRLTGQSDTLPFVCLNKYKISAAFIENSGFDSFRHEI